ncbi:MAG: hypothetical protein RLZZ609_858 [Cyanobacteriota bacterium]|jgi:hypothetical protein
MNLSADFLTSFSFNLSMCGWSSMTAMPSTNDPALEREADEMGARTLRVGER